MWKKYLNSNVAAEKVMFLTALGCATKASLIEEYLKKILTDDIRPQDKTLATVSTFRSENLDTVIDFVLSKHTKLSQA